MYSKQSLLHLFLVATCTLFMTSDLFAAQVRSVKGRRLIISLQGDSMKAGQFYYIISNSGKKKGIIKIKKVKSRSALALLGKGKARKGDSLKLRKKRRRRGRRSSMARSGNSKSYWGFMAGYSMNSAEVQLKNNNGSNAEKVDLDGSGFSAKAFFDYPLLTWLHFRGMTGLDQFNIGGEDNSLCNSSECTAEITYITFDFWGRIPFGSGNFKPWVGAGFDLLFPVTKEATALDEGSITNTSIFAIGGGFDWWLDRNSFVPIQLEYGIYPSSDQVDANTIAIRAGYGMQW